MLKRMREELWTDPRGGLAFRLNQAADNTPECHGETLRKIITGTTK